MPILRVPLAALLTALALVLLVLVGCGGEDARTDSPAASPQQTTAADEESTSKSDGIVFSMRGADDRFHLYVVSTEGGAPRQLTDGDGDQFDPAVSADGTTIAHTQRDPSIGDCHESEKCRVEIIGVDGGEARLLTAGYDPSFSPEGRVVFTQTIELTDAEDVNYLEYKRVLQVIPATGGKPTGLLGGEEWEDFEGRKAVFSPDGSQIAYVAESGDLREDDWGLPAVVNADGSEPRSISGGYAKAVAWIGPESLGIVGTNQENCAAGSGWSASSDWLGAIRLVTGDRYSYAVGPSITRSCFDYSQPAWSADGQKFVAIKRDPDKDGIDSREGEGQLVLVGVDGEERVLAEGALAPAWMPSRADR